MAGNKSHLEEIQRLASEMAMQIGLLTIDDSTATKYKEQTIAKVNAEEGLKEYQEDEIHNLQQVFE